MTRKPRIALALQGGGSYGAYGWGAVDRLLEEELDIVTVSGASAGALNGAALVTGLVAGGRAGARETLQGYWRRVAAASPLSGFAWPESAEPFFEPWLRHSLSLFRAQSGYLTPFLPSLRGMSSLRRVASAGIDLDLLARQNTVPLHVSATDVLTGAPKIFTGAELTLDALMASSCLPELFDAVDIDGRLYWDGGFSANPALEPLLFNDLGVTDLVVVQLTPFTTEAIGRLPSDVTARVSDISFNACLLRDLRTLTELQSIVRSTGAAEPRLQAIADINVHLIVAPAELTGRGAASKLDSRWSTLSDLRDLGRSSTSAWLDEHRDALGEESSLLSIADAVSTTAPSEMPDARAA